MGVDKLADMRSAGRGPRFIKIGRNVRYSWHDVNAFVASCAIAGAAA
jgi:predicted DNA-binding transcriptional regulator AlpA